MHRTETSHRSNHKINQLRYLSEQQQIAIASFDSCVCDAEEIDQYEQ